MNKQEALEYCFKHRNQFIRDNFCDGENGTLQFNCLITILEEETIKPEELKDYGMDYK